MKRVLYGGVYCGIDVRKSENNEYVRLNVFRKEFNAEELREAAHLFNQLAEFLESKE